jgi:hypothetical protein
MSVIPSPSESKGWIFTAKPFCAVIVGMQVWADTVAANIRAANKERMDLNNMFF